MNKQQLRDLNFLVVEDDDLEWLLLQRSLAKAWQEPHQIFRVTGIQEAIKILEMTRIDFILLDLNVVDSQGLNTVHSMARVTKTICPIVVTTSMKDKSMAVQALQKGAQDYIVKGEYSPQDLNRVIEYSLARYSGKSSEQFHPNVRLDTKRLKLISNVNGFEQEVDLTAIEFKLASLFVSKFGQIISREDLLTQVLGEEASTSERTTDNQVSRLRTKVKNLGLNVASVRGVGYRIEIQKS